MTPRAATQAKSLLAMASRRLHTSDPSVALDRVLEHALPLPVGHRAYSRARLPEPQYSETAGDHLALVMSTGGPGATPDDHLESARQTQRDLVDRHYGREAVHWLDGRTEALRGRGTQRRWGGWFGGAFDGRGMSESFATFEWGPQLMDGLPAPLFRLAQTALESLPGLRPAFSTIRCGRQSGSQQLTFDVDRALPLVDLRPLMDRMNLGPQHASLVSACAFALGARFVLPPGSATITLRPTRVGAELRLDVNLDAVPDAPSQLMSLLRMQMAERPRSLRAFDRWTAALTPDGYDAPGAPSVLSVGARPDMPVARVALYLRPAVFDGRDEGEAHDVEELSLRHHHHAPVSAWAPRG